MIALVGFLVASACGAEVLHDCKLHGGGDLAIWLVGATLIAVESMFGAFCLLVMFGGAA